MKPEITIKKLEAAINLTEIEWSNGAKMQGNYVTINRKHALALLRLLKPENESTGSSSHSSPPSADVHSVQTNGVNAQNSI